MMVRGWLVGALIVALRLAVNVCTRLFHRGVLATVPMPVVKLFTPDADATWLLGADRPPGDPDIAFGLCGLGMGLPELGCMRLSELAALRGMLGAAH